MTRRIVLLAVLLIASWCVMTLSHELGHILGGWVSGGTLLDADLRPWQLPYSIFEPDPHPLVTLWCGPVLGVVIPLSLAAAIRQSWAWLISHFCTLANGAYLATGWVAGDSHLDTTKLLEHGASPAAIATYCLLTIGIGYAGFRRSCRKLLGNLDGTAGRT